MIPSKIHTENKELQLQQQFEVAESTQPTENEIQAELWMFNFI